MEIPDSLNYDMWLGPTPKAPYTEDRVHPRDGFGRPGWLQIEQYCRGMITGWGAHMYDIAQWAMGEDQDSGPVQVQASAVFPDRGLFDVHTSFEARAEYANGVELVSGSGNPPGVRFTGSDGWISVQRGSFDAHDEDVLREPAGDDRITLYRSDNHMANFLQCLREGTQPAAPAEVGHRANSVCVTHHIAMKLNRALRWDPAQERFENDSEANELLDYQHRAPWTL
jgi:predicted dehydrogenase